MKWGLQIKGKIKQLESAKPRMKSNDCQIEIISVNTDEKVEKNY